MGNGAIPDIRAVIGGDTALARAADGELAGPCPKCGGNDRFRVSVKRNLCVCSHCHDRNGHWLTPADYVMWRDGVTFPEAKTKLGGDMLPPPPPIRPIPAGAEPYMRGPVVATYDYIDEHGALLYQVCRHEPKTFSQRRPDGNGGWIGALGDTRRVLYRLPDLLARPQSTVFIVEGEKDADTLAAMGLLATCNSGGAGKWADHYTERLAGRHIVLIPDMDDAGEKHRVLVESKLAGNVATLVTLTLPGDGKDVSDWVAAGGTADQLKALVTAARRPEPIFPGEIGADELALIQFPPPVAYVPGILFEGASLFAAPPKSGKSISTLGMAVALATGGYAFGTIKVAKRRVVYFTLEDPLELIQERMLTMQRGGQCPPLLRMVPTCGPLSELAGNIERYVQRYPDTGMVVIDTLAHARGGTPRARKDIVQEDYQELIGFSHLAHRLHIAIVIITHTAKAQYDDELAQVSGTFGLSGAVDAIMILQRRRHSPEANLAVFSRRLGSEKKLELHWDAETLSYILDGEMAPEKASRTTSTVIVECLQGATAPLSIRSVSELCQLSYEVAKQRLFQLSKSGELAKTDEGKYSLPNSGRNRRNFVTTPERNTGTDPYFDGYAGEDAEDDDELPEMGGGVTGHNRDFKSKVTPVTVVTGVVRCSACGHTGTSPAPWDPDESMCAKCGVSTNPIPF